jgi:ABC-type Zn uptake system ZnuABC Zn-binding protein ZnuA
VIGTPLGVSTETSEPSARDIAGLIETIEDAGVPAVFTENVENTSLMEQIASDAGVTLAPPLYTDALGDDQSEAATYIDLMTYNVEVIVTALSA